MSPSADIPLRARSSAPLLAAITESGVVGVDASKEQQARVEELASSLAGTGDEIDAPARVPLSAAWGRPPQAVSPRYMAHVMLVSVV